jgi:hypothetical protein
MWHLVHYFFQFHVIIIFSKIRFQKEGSTIFMLFPFVQIVTANYVLLQIVSDANFPVAIGGELGLIIQLYAARGKHHILGTIPSYSIPSFSN